MATLDHRVGINLRVNGEQWQRFLKTAKADGRRKTDVFRLLVDAYISSNGKVISNLYGNIA